MSSVRPLIAAVAAFVFLPSIARGQSPRIKPSQLASVTQSIGATEVKITWRRPVARGRALFGSLVKWGEIWTPAADSAVVFTTSTPITVEGKPLDAGSYAIWAIPDSASWTVIFSRDAAVFHLRYPGPSRDALRVTVSPRKGDHMETLAFYFPVVDGTKAELRLHWGTTIVPLQLEGRTP